MLEKASLIRRDFAQCRAAERPGAGRADGRTNCLGPVRSSRLLARYVVRPGHIGNSLVQGHG